MSVIDDYIAAITDRETRLAVVMVVIAAQLWHEAPVEHIKIDLLHSAVAYLNHITKQQ